MIVGPLIAITQRVEVVASRGEVRDALDQAWGHFYRSAGARLLVLPNQLDDPVEYLFKLGVQGLVLSGGNDLSRSFITRDGSRADVEERPGIDIQFDRELLESKLLAGSLVHGWPVLGVCRGMQAMNLFHGGRLQPVTEHTRIRHRLTCAAPLPSVCLAFDEEVNSFHDSGVPISGVAPGFAILARVGDVAEAIWNPELRQLGVMWHPERNTPFSPNDLRMFQDLFGMP